MILVVGNINYDILFPLDRLPGPHEKMACGRAVTGFGGSAANTAYWLARLGVQVLLAGCVGDDPLGRAVLGQLQDAGVDTGGVRMADESTGVAVIFSLGVEKRMVRAPGANLRGQVVPEVAAVLNTGGERKCRLVYLSGADTDLLAAYAAAAREGGLTVICGGHGAGEARVAGLANGFILNADEVRSITAQTDPEEGILALDSEMAAVTLPTGGCLVSEGIEVVKVPSGRLDPVDRTGGGDAFAAGFLAGMARGMDVTQCGRWGNALASEVIMGMGARPEIVIPDFGLSTADSRS